MTVITREGLERSVPFVFRSDIAPTQGDGLTLSGHAAVFNQETEIDSWEGTFLETIAPGAFRKTIRERTPVLQFDHGRHPLVGSIPIGSIASLSEDAEGLYVEARMTDNWLIQPVIDAIRNQSINGMSFRFEVIRDRWEDNTGKEIRDPTELYSLLWDAGDRGPIKRTLKEVKVAELGPVVFPAYEGTSVDMRSREIANLVLQDDHLRREVRSALARNTESLTIDCQDLHTRQSIARAILFGTSAEDGHLSIAEFESVSNEPPDEGTRSEDVDPPEVEVEVVPDAPLTHEHPSRPVSSDLKMRMNYALRSMGRRLDSVSEELLNAREEGNGA